MSGVLVLRNRQRARAVDLRFLRRITKALLREFVQTESFDLGVYLVNGLEMTGFNETFLRHQGSTDVITFDYSEIAGEASGLSNPHVLLHGEILICVDQAVAQARQFRTTWQSELARYLIHGILHLQGYDDLQPTARRRMRLKEIQLLRILARQFDLAKISPSREASPKP